MAVADQIPRFANALDADRTTQIQDIIFGKPLPVEIDNTNALAVTLTSTTYDAGAGTSAAHDWYKHGQLTIVAGSPAPSAAITITVTQASGGGDPEYVGLRYVDNQTAQDVTIIGASQESGVDGALIPAGTARLIFIEAVNIVRINSDASAIIADNSVTLAKLEDGTQGDILYYGASGEPARLPAGTSGHVLKTQGAGANPQWAAETVSGASVNAQTGTTYTLVLGDANDIVTMSNASTNTLTIPTNASVAFDVGTVVSIIQKGAGATTVAAASGVTLNGVTTGSGAINAQWDGVSIVKIATDEWIMNGAHGGVS